MEQEQKKFEPYVYYTPSGHKKGVRVTVVGSVTDGVLNFAVSRCGEEDRYKFTKEHGRNEAIKRLENGVFTASVKCDKPSSAKFIAVATVIGDFVVKHSTLRKLELNEFEYVSEVKITTLKNGIVESTFIDSFDVELEYQVVKTKKKRKRKAKRKARVVSKPTIVSEEPEAQV